MARSDFIGQIRQPETKTQYGMQYQVETRQRAGVLWALGGPYEHKTKRAVRDGHAARGIPLVRLRGIGETAVLRRVTLK